MHITVLALHLCITGTVLDVYCSLHMDTGSGVLRVLLHPLLTRGGIVAGSGGDRPTNASLSNWLTPYCTNVLSSGCRGRPKLLNFWL